LKETHFIEQENLKYGAVVFHIPPPDNNYDIYNRALLGFFMAFCYFFSRSIWLVMEKVTGGKFSARLSLLFYIRF
ncbi:MAG: hypothetical protein LUD38_13880, partial [Parabacteroides sp.]|nr:hypothetical protein [Parabacteroides sp.]